MGNPSCGCGSIYYFKLFYNSNLVGVIDASNFNQFINLMSSNKEKISYQYLSKIRASIENSDNPLLVIGKIKM
jgi:hypothetical protein